MMVHIWNACTKREKQKWFNEIELESELYLSNRKMYCFTAHRINDFIERQQSHKIHRFERNTLH